MRDSLVMRTLYLNGTHEESAPLTTGSFDQRRWSGLDKGARV